MKSRIKEQCFCSFLMFVIVKMSENVTISLGMTNRNYYTQKNGIQEENSLLI